MNEWLSKQPELNCKRQEWIWESREFHGLGLPRPVPAHCGETSKPVAWCGRGHVTQGHLQPLLTAHAKNLCESSPKSWVLVSLGKLDPKDLGLPMFKVALRTSVYLSIKCGSCNFNFFRDDPKK